MRMLAAAVTALLLTTALAGHSARAASQSECQTEECRKARTGQESQCRRGSPPISHLPDALSTGRPAFA